MNGFAETSGEFHRLAALQRNLRRYTIKRNHRGQKAKICNNTLVGHTNIPLYRSLSKPRRFARNSMNQGAQRENPKGKWAIQTRAHQN